MSKRLEGLLDGIFGGEQRETTEEFLALVERELNKDSPRKVKLVKKPKRKPREPAESTKG